MAETYARIIVTLPWSEKVTDIADKDRAAAFGFYTAACCYCQENLTDGRIRRAELVKVFPCAKPERMAELLVKARLFNADEDAYHVHDYLDWNKSRAEIEEEIEQKREAGRAGGLAKSKRNPSRSLAPAIAPAKAHAMAESWQDSSTALAEVYPATDTATDTAKERVSITGEVDALLGSFTGDRSAALPSCLSKAFPQTLWPDSSGTNHTTAASAFWASVASARNGLVSTADHGTFCGIVKATCRPGCEGSEDDVARCLMTLKKAAAKSSGKPSGLFRTIAKEDR
jgi:hypothetical protein